MKVTFISPYYQNIWESLGIGYIKSYCDKYYHGFIKWKFLQGNFDSNLLEQTLDSDIVAFSCTTPTFQRALSLAYDIKNINPFIHIVMGGWHTTTTQENPWETVIDQIVIGEGETAFEEILKGNRDKIVFGKYLDFDKLSWPDRKFIKNERTLNLCESLVGERIGSFQSRRGCSHNCTMCGEHCMTKRNIRIRDPKDVLDEIHYVKLNYNINKFKFLDATWAYPKQSVIDFAEEYIKRNETLPWEAMCHAAYLNEEVLDAMKASNCKQINIGVESGDPKVLKAIKKGVTIQKIKDVFAYGNKIGLDMRAFFMIGVPEENYTSYDLTKELIREIKPSVFGMTILCPYPGTAYYSDKFKYGINWSDQGEYDNDIWSTPKFFNSDLKRIKEEFNNEFKDILVGHQK